MVAATYRWYLAIRQLARIEPMSLQQIQILE